MAGTASTWNYHPWHSVSLYQLPSTRPMAGMCPFFTFTVRILCTAYRCPFWHVCMGRDVPPFSPSQVYSSYAVARSTCGAGSIELLRRCLGRMRAEGPTCFSARGIAGYGVCVFGIRPTGAAETQSVCFFCSFRARGLTHICLLPRATALG